MSFEEDFPSFSDESSSNYSIWNLPIEENVVKERIAEFCLDKQRIRDIIKELSTSIYDGGELCINPYQLSRRLGL